MKRVFILFFCSIYIFCFIIFPSVLLLQQCLVKIEISSFLISNNKSTQHTILQLNLKESKLVNWLNDEEFIYQNSTYDLVKKDTLENNLIQLTAICDEKENSILNTLSENSEKNKNVKEIITNVLSSFSYYTPFEKVNIIPSQQKLFSNGISYSVKNYTSVYIHIYSPPPEIS